MILIQGDTFIRYERFGHDSLAYFSYLRGRFLTPKSSSMKSNPSSYLSE